MRYYFYRQGYYTESELKVSKDKIKFIIDTKESNTCLDDNGNRFVMDNGKVNVILNNY